MGTPLYASHQDSYPSSDTKQEMCPITPNAGPKTEWKADPFFTLDFIYWTPRQEGLAYALDGMDLGAFSITPNTSGHIYDPDWDFDPGFKVGTGVKMQHDGWDVYANYTWFHSSANDSVSGSRDTGLFPTGPNALFFLLNVFPTPPSTIAFVSAKQNWDLHFNVIDLEIGRDYHISHCLTLRPHIGFKGTWQDQDLRARYDMQDNNAFTVHKHQDSWGLGIRTGLDGCWYFARSLGLYGDFALSGLWSGCKNIRRDHRVLEDLSLINILDTRDLTHTIKPVIEFGLGLRYQYFYHNDDFRFLLQGGWEEQIWLGHNHFIDMAEYGDKGNLSLQGLTLEARLDF